MGKKTHAKEVNSKITKHIAEHTLEKPGEPYSLSTTGLILITAICVLLAVLILDWSSGIKPPPVEPQLSVSVTRLNQNQVSVMIIHLQHDTIVRRLMYSTSHETGTVYKSPGSLDLVKDAGEYGTIPVPGYDQSLEITAVLDDNKTIKLYRENI